MTDVRFLTEKSLMIFNREMEVPSYKSSFKIVFLWNIFQVVTNSLTNTILMILDPRFPYFTAKRVFVGQKSMF